MESVRFGIVGIGNIGSVHAKNLCDGKIKGATLAAVCDKKDVCGDWANENLKNAPFYKDYSEMIASANLDAIIIATPHYEHCPIGIASFKSGLHVLSEKPIGVYTKQAEELCSAARQSGKVFGIMFNQRTDPLFKTVKSMIENGEIGDPLRLLWIVTNWYRTQEYYESSDWRATWVGEGGGVLLNQAVHNIDLWQWLFGMPSAIRGACSFGKYHDIEVEDEVSIYAQYRQLSEHTPAPTAIFVSSTGEFPGTNRLEITGSTGKLVAEDGTLTLWKNNDDNTQSTSQKVQVECEDYMAGHNAILQNFTNSILHGDALIAPGYDGQYSLEIANATLLSTWTNSTITLPVDKNKYYELLQEKIATSQKKEKTDTSKPSGEYTSRWDVKW